MAIIEYLDDMHPEPRLLPTLAAERAHVRALAELIACEIHPLNNMRVLNYLSSQLNLDEERRNGWYRHCVRTGLEMYERVLARLPASKYSFGDTPTPPDCRLVPQIFNVRRVNTDYIGLDRPMVVFDACMALPAFQKAQPTSCPDSE